VRTRIGLAVLGLAALTGCGGGGSSSGTAALATQSRAYQPGDKWVYAVTGQSKDATGKTTTANGTLTISISMQPFKGGSALAEETVLAITAADGQTFHSDSTTYLSQDPNTHDVVELGDNNGSNNAIRTATNRVISLPGVWSNGLSNSGTVTFDDGTTEAFPLTVTGSETVQTPAGSFTAWITAIGTDPTMTEDWAPQLGAAVKITLKSSAPDGSGLSFTAVLSSTTVAH
jgi:hypothetical protein